VSGLRPASGLSGPCPVSRNCKHACCVSAKGGGGGSAYFRASRFAVFVPHKMPFRWRDDRNIIAVSCVTRGHLIVSGR